MTEQLSWIRSEDLSPRKITTLQMYLDGAARGNPGPAGIGVYILRDKEVLVREGFYLGPQNTNNQAEYSALLVGICHARMLLQPHEQLAIFSDSELLILQVKQTYRVKNPVLQKLHAKARELLQTINYTVHHVPRSENRIADALANEGIDKLRYLPENIKIMCELEGILP